MQKQRSLCFNSSNDYRQKYPMGCQPGRFSQQEAIYLHQAVPACKAATSGSFNNTPAVDVFLLGKWLRKGCVRKRQTAYKGGQPGSRWKWWTILCNITQMGTALQDAWVSCDRQHERDCKAMAKHRAALHHQETTDFWLYTRAVGCAWSARTAWLSVFLRHHVSCSTSALLQAQCCLFHPRERKGDLPELQTWGLTSKAFLKICSPKSQGWD